MKYVLGIIGIAFTISGWLVSNSQQFPAINKLLAPQYNKAIAAFEKLHTNGIVLTNQNEGFIEIASLLKEDITGEGEPDIISIKTLYWYSETRNTKSGLDIQKSIELEISFSNAPPLIGKFYRLESRIEEAYQNNKIFIWATIIFWLGVVLSVCALFFELFSSRNKIDSKA